MAQLKKTIEMDPSFVRAHFLLGRAYAQNGQCNEAIAEFQKARSLESGVEMLGALAQGYASCGKSSEAKGVVDDLLQLSKQLYVSPHWLAATYAGIGDKDEAFKWLDKAFEMRFGPLIYLKVNPIWDPLRSDPRFAERLRRLGLAP
jgi:Tfp pilus assembly protein PilF